MARRRPLTITNIVTKTVQTLLLINSLSVVLLPSTFITTSTALEIDDYCDSQRIPSSSNPIEYDYNKCNPTVGLYCNPYLSRCTCFVTDSEYSDYHDRCIAKVGHPCKASPAFRISCVENADCDEDTGFCICKPKYVSNEIKTRCDPADQNMYVYYYNGSDQNIVFAGFILTLTLLSFVPALYLFM